MQSTGSSPGLDSPAPWHLLCSSFGLEVPRWVAQVACVIAASPPRPWVSLLLSRLSPHSFVISGPLFVTLSTCPDSELLEGRGLV